MTKGGKQHTRPSELNGQETAKEVGDLIEQLIKERANPERIKQLRGWWKVMKGGGKRFGIVVAVALAVPEIASAAQEKGGGGVAGDIIIGTGTNAVVGAGVVSVGTVTVGGTAVTGVVATTGVGEAVITTAVVGYGIGNAIGGVEVGGQTIHDHIADGNISSLNFFGLW